MHVPVPAPLLGKQEKIIEFLKYGKQAEKCGSLVHESTEKTHTTTTPPPTDGKQIEWDDCTKNSFQILVPN